MGCATWWQRPVTALTQESGHSTHNTHCLAVHFHGIALKINYIKRYANRPHFRSSLSQWRTQAYKIVLDLRSSLSSINVKSEERLGKHVQYTRKPVVTV